jgi:protein-tyrosine phosphatase
MSSIFDNLFLGDLVDAKNLKFLKQNQVSHILIVAEEFEPFYPKSFVYMHIKAEDSESFELIKYFDMMADFINFSSKKGGCVLVHCAMGVSRSPTAIIAFLMKHQKWSFLKAKKFVEEKRNIISPNNFLNQLKEYENILKERRHPWKNETSPKIKPLCLKKQSKAYK